MFINLFDFGMTYHIKYIKLYKSISKLKLKKEVINIEYVKNISLHYSYKC